MCHAVRSRPSQAFKRITLEKLHTLGDGMRRSPVRGFGLRKQLQFDLVFIPSGSYSSWHDKRFSVHSTICSWPLTSYHLEYSAAIYPSCFITIPTTIPGSRLLFSRPSLRDSARLRRADRTPTDLNSQCHYLFQQRPRVKASLCRHQTKV